MEVVMNKKQTGFVPYEISIKVESKEDEDALYNEFDSITDNVNEDDHPVSWAIYGLL